jgi:HK97 family phage major capsid protein
MNTRQMLERRTALVTQLREMQDTADSNANGEMTADQAAAFEKLKAALVELESAMTRRSVIEDAERRMTGQPIGGTGDRRLDDDISRRYSWTRALAGAAGLKTDDSYEREVSAELARRSGREPGGFFAPLLALNPPMERRVTTTTAPNGFPGGNVIGTYLDPSLFIPPLYAALTIRKAGARVISGLVSNVDIPQQSQSVVGSWVAENTPLTFTDPGFTRVSLRPKHYGAITEFSRNMLLQSTPDIEALLRADMTNVLARGLDAAAIAGTGTANDPVGILNQTGIGTVSMGTNGAPLTWAAVLSLIEQVELYNIGDDSRAFISNPRVRASAMQIPKVPNVALGFIQDDRDMLAGNPFYATTLAPSGGTKGTGSNLSTLLYGNFSDLLLGMWSEIDILVNPYAEVAYSKGNVQVRAMMMVDVEVRHPQSFAVITDLVAA